MIGHNFGMEKSAVALTREARIAKCAAVMADDLQKRDVSAVVHPDDVDAECQRRDRLGYFKPDCDVKAMARERRQAMRESTLGSSLKGYV